MRSIGQGYSSIQKFTALMNMPQTMTLKNYDRSVKIISKVVQDVTDAANELKEKQGTDNLDVSVSMTKFGTICLILATIIYF